MEEYYKYKIESSKGWLFPSIGEEDCDLINSLLDDLMPNIYAVYMENCKVITVNEVTQINEESNLLWLKRYLQELINGNGLSGVIRIEANDNTFNVEFTECHEGKITLLISRTNSISAITYVIAYSIDLNKKAKDMIDICTPPFFYGNDDKAVKQEIKFCMATNSFYIMDIAYICHALGELIHMNFKFRFPNHTKAEGILFQSIVTQFSHEGPYKRTIRIASNVKNAIVRTAFVDDFYGHVIAEADPKYNIDLVPEVDLSDKEWKFIDDFIAKKELLGFDKKVSIRPYVEHPRYGNAYRMKMFMNAYDRKVEYVFKFIVSGSKMDLYIIQRINSNTSIYLETTVNDIDNFSMEDCYNRFVVVLVNSTMTKAPKNINELDSIFVNILDHIADGYNLMLDAILSLMIVMKERPQRTRMVRCTTTKNGKKGSSSRNNKDKSNVHTVRLLKTKSEAKKLVSESSGSSEKSSETGKRHRVEAVYRVEEWEREGHYRTTKLGKTVWVNGTTCKRHLPINEEKEIRIKL